MTSSAFETATPDAFAYLDRVAATGLGRSYKRHMLDELGVRPGETALDLGCGPGTDLGALAEAVTATGTVIGIDHDRASVDTARDRSAERSNVTVRLGDVHQLPLPDHCADRARTDRVLQHVDDPARALGEARRTQPSATPASAASWPDWRRTRDSPCPGSYRSPPSSGTSGPPMGFSVWSAPRAAQSTPDTSPRSRRDGGWTTFPTAPSWRP
ncbi:methyltransferase domain-containing protein [Streptomyces gelaticus]